ncbi:MAG: tetratricopeptide repeat protein, partial [Candidatus Binatia bacterium]
LHVLNCLLIYCLLRQYVSPTTALMGSVLFATHPIHTEAVTYISGRGEILMAFLLLSGTLLFLQSEKHRSWPLYVASLALFFFSLLSKETAVIFPLLLITADLTAHPISSRREIPRRLVRQIGPLVSLSLYFILRKFFVGITLSGYGSPPPDFVHHLLLVLKAIPLYVGLLLLPWNLHFLHRIDPSTSPLDVQLLLAILLLVGAGWGLRYAMRSGNQAVLFAFLWFLLGLLPLVHFIGLNLPLLEGWIYLPSLGFFLLVALGISRLQFWSPSRLHIWLALLIATLLGVVTLDRNEDWRDEMHISLHTNAASPDDPVALRLWGNARFKRGRTYEAEKTFQKAVLIESQDPRLHESLGRLYSFFGRESEALASYQRMRELTPKDPYPYWRLGRFYLRRRNFAEAENYFAKAASLFPYSSELRNDLAQVYYLQGKLDAAEAEIRSALKILPRSPILQDNLEQILRRKG